MAIIELETRVQLRQFIFSMKLRFNYVLTDNSKDTVAVTMALMTFYI